MGPTAESMDARTGRRVAEVMTEPFVSVRPMMRATDAAARLRHHRVRTAPVITAEGELVGVLSESDLVRAGHGVAGPTDDGVAVSGDPLVSEVMRPFAVTVRPTAGIAEAEAVMERNGVRWLVVVDARGHVVGVLSRSAIGRGVEPFGDR